MPDLIFNSENAAASQDRGGLLICTVNAVLFDGRNKILNLKFHN